MITADPAKIKRNKQKGQSMVELALITPLLLIALYIPADFGLAYFMANMTGTAVREGARIGSGLAEPFGNAEAVKVKTEVFARMPNNTYVTNRSVSVNFYAGASCVQSVEVAATIRYNYFLYQLIRLFGGSVNNFVPITRTTRMRYNYQPNTNTTLCSAATPYGPYAS